MKQSLFFLVLLLAFTSTTLAASQKIFDEKNLKIGITSDYNLEIGKGDFYKKRNSSLVPKEFMVLVLDKQEIDKLRKNFKKFKKWSNINKKKKLSFKKKLYETNDGKLILKFIGDKKENKLKLYIETAGANNIILNEKEIYSLSNKLNEEHLTGKVNELKTIEKKRKKIREKQKKEKKKKEKEIDKTFN